MLNVLHIVGDSVGGIRKHVHDIIFGLNGEFNFFYICSNNTDETFKKDIPVLSKIILDFMQLNIAKKPSLSDVSNIVKIFSFVKKNNINIVHGHGAKGGLYARIVGMIANVKVCYTPHGGVVHSMFNRYEEFLYARVEIFLIPWTTQFIFESFYTKNSFFKKFNVKKDLKFIINYNGIAFDEVKDSDVLHKTDDTLYIGFFGMLREEKGILFSIDVIEKISHNLNVKYFIYGDGPLKNTIERVIDEKKLSSKISLEGYVTDVSEAMQNVDVVFLPSLFESFGYVAVEAMYLKKPLVCSDTGALPEVVGSSYPFIFSSGSVSEACEKLHEIEESMRSPAFNEKLETYSINTKIKFSQTNMLANLVKCYSNL